MLNILLILLPVFILSVNFILIKQSFLLNFNGDKHQKFVTKKEIPLSGGFFLFVYLVIFFIVIEFLCQIIYFILYIIVIITIKCLIISLTSRMFAIY